MRPILERVAFVALIVSAVVCAALTVFAPEIARWRERRRRPMPSESEGTDWEGPVYWPLTIESDPSRTDRRVN